MRLINKTVLFAALLAMFAGFLAAPDALAEGNGESYFFNRRQSAEAEYALVGPHTTLDATNTAIRWSMDNGYEVQWEADGSAPRIMVEGAAPVVTEAPTQVIVNRIVYVTPRYNWSYWNSYRYYWRNFKVKYNWRGWKHHHGYKHFKHYNGHHNSHRPFNWRNGNYKKLNRGRFQKKLKRSTRRTTKRFKFKRKHRSKK